MADAAAPMTEPASPILHTSVTYGQVRYDYGQMLEKVGGTSNRVLRVAPLLIVVGDRGSRRVVVGKVCAVVSDRPAIEVEVAVSGAWSEQKAENSSSEWMHEDNSAATSALVEQSICTVLVRSYKRGSASDNEGYAAALAKTLCESARDRLVELREMRYELEQQLALTSSAKESSPDHTMVVSFLLQLNVMLSRAADASRELQREGLWVFLTDDEAYHAYRKRRDPMLITRYPEATLALRPWMWRHDAAIRHCEAMSRQIEGDALAIRSLVDCAASISSSREADAQARFNVLAAIASVGLGLPALVLALYGTSILLPLNTGPRLVAFLPVVVSLGIATGIAVWQGHRIKRARVWGLSAGGIVIVLLALMLAAGLLAPEVP